VSDITEPFENIGTVNAGLLVRLSKTTRITVKDKEKISTKEQNKLINHEKNNKISRKSEST
jgi:hypothetical protein